LLSTRVSHPRGLQQSVERGSWGIEPFAMNRLGPSSPCLLRPIGSRAPIQDLPTLAPERGAATQTGPSALPENFDRFMTPRERSSLSLSSTVSSPVKPAARYN
jgi:hypothetical protein